MPNKNISVAVICGGLSPEADVSRISASQIVPLIETHYGKAVQLELDDTLPTLLQQHKVDVAFPIAHGTYGEDGRLQGLLDILGIPYVGSGALASSLAMDKVATKRMLREHDVTMPDDCVVFRSDDRNEAARECIAKLGDRVVVKPVAQGSGIGVQFAEGEDDLSKKLDEGLGLDERLLVEQRIVGREMTAGVLHLDDYQVFAVTEVTTPNGAWYDYTHRYTPGLSSHTLPADIPEEHAERTQQMALTAHKALGCMDLSRSDFIYSESLGPVFTEINNLPGMTPTSLYPDGAKHAGITFDSLICQLIDHALKRGGTGAVGAAYWPIPKLNLSD